MKQQIQFMFPWCRSVNVFNIENHYHFYAESQPRKQPNNNISFSKLKVAPIEVLNADNSKRNSKSCTKRGLNLCKNLESYPNPEQNSVSKQYMRTKAHGEQEVSNYSNTQHARSATISQNDISRTRCNEHEVYSKQVTKPSSISTQTQTLLNCQIQIAPYQYHRHKPSPSVSTSKNININQQLRQENNMLLTKLYSTQSKSNYLINTCSKGIRSSCNNDQHDITPIQNKEDIIDLTTSRNVCSREKTQSYIQQINPNNISVTNSHSHSRSRSRYQESNSGYGYNNSKYNVSKSLSASAAAGNQNEGFYFRIMQTSRGQARQASIILSNILSRDSQNCYSSMHLTPTRIRPQQDKRMLFQDKQTILSHENDMSSESELKIEQSQLNDMDPRNNFIVIPHKAIKRNSDTVNLAIQNSMKCLVSLKEIGFIQMSAISQQLQMYEFIDHLNSSDTFRNILQLYQVQMTGSSYILIKEPYTNSLSGHIQTLSAVQANFMITQFHQILISLLFEFGEHMLHPWRLLTLNDFVVCGDCVVKLHDLSVFRTMKTPIFQIAELLHGLTLQQKSTLGAQ